MGLSIGTALAFSSATFPVLDGPFTRIWHQLLPLSAYIKLQTQQQFIGSPLQVSAWPLATLLLMTVVAGGIGGLRLIAFARTPRSRTAGGGDERTLAQLRQTLMVVLCDRYAIVVMVGAVILYSFFYPAAYRHQVASNLPVLVVDEDHSATSRELLQARRTARCARGRATGGRRQRTPAAGSRPGRGIVVIPANLSATSCGHPAAGTAWQRRLPAAPAGCWAA